jgi:type II secretory ATPase GspE/PulE/Tfp pilus assembly ATPase PilB-like protein
VEQFFQKLLNWIQENGFSDLYIEPAGSERDFYFIKGKKGKVITLKEKLSYKEGEKLLNFLRVQARISTYQHKPSEGYFAYQNLAFRLTSLPGYFGDILSLRVIYREPFDWLFSEKNGEDFNQQLLTNFLNTYDLSYPVFFTGKPSQGKTTTMFFVLKRLAQKGYRIISYEEPIEFILDSILQFNREYFKGLDVKNIYKYLLRLSPDIVVIGELREKEDWVLAQRISKVGIPLFATFHSSDIVSAVKIISDFRFPSGSRLYQQKLTDSGPLFSSVSFL